MSGVYKLRAIITTLVLLALGYTALWYTVGFRTQKAAAATLSGWFDQGLDVEHGKITLSGFPYRLILEIDGLAVSTRRPGLKLETGTLVLVSHLWTPDHWIAQANEVTTVLGRGTIAFTEDFLQASYRVHAGDKLVIKIDSDGAKDMALRSPGGLPQLDAWSLLIGKDNGGGTANSGLYEKRTLELKFYAQTGKDTLEIAGGISGPGIRDGSVEQLSSWRDDGGLLELDDLKWNVGSNVVTLNGDVTLDENFKPLGSAALNVKDWGEFKKSMAGLGVSVGNAPINGAALMMQNGSAILGDRKILSLPRIDKW